MKSPTDGPLPARCRLALAALVVGALFACDDAPGLTALSGVVTGVDGPVAGAVVRIQATSRTTTTNAAGRFTFEGLDPKTPVPLTAWAPGYYSGGGEEHLPDDDLQLELKLHPSEDDPSYSFSSSFGDDGCEHCHSQGGVVLFDEWRQDAHGGSATNPRFLTMYAGTECVGQTKLFRLSGVELPGWFAAW